MRKISYFTKPELLAAVKAGNKRGYNRQLDADDVEAGLDDDMKFPVVFSMLHEHINGQAVEPHMRVMIVTDANGGQAILDISMERFDELRSAEVDDQVDA